MLCSILLKKTEFLYLTHVGYLSVPLTGDCVEKLVSVVPMSRHRGGFFICWTRVWLVLYGMVASRVLHMCSHFFVCLIAA